MEPISFASKVTLYYISDLKAYAVETDLRNSCSFFNFLVICWTLTTFSQIVTSNFIVRILEWSISIVNCSKTKLIKLF